MDKGVCSKRQILMLKESSEVSPAYNTRTAERSSRLCIASSSVVSSDPAEDASHTAEDLARVLIPNPRSMSYPNHHHANTATAKNIVPITIDPNRE